MTSAEAAVKNIYQNMQENLSMMIIACKSDAQRTSIRVGYSKALRNYNACINKAFQEGDPVLLDLVDKANSVAAQLKDINRELGDMKKVIGIVETGVAYGAEIIGKIVAA